MVLRGGRAVGERDARDEALHEQVERRAAHEHAGDPAFVEQPRKLGHVYISSSPESEAIATEFVDALRGDGAGSLTPDATLALGAENPANMVLQDRNGDGAICCSNEKHPSLCGAHTWGCGPFFCSTLPRHNFGIALNLDTHGQRQG